MTRLVALTVALSVGITPLTYAGEGLMQSASRIVRQQTTDNPTPATAQTRPAARSEAMKGMGAWTAPHFAAQGGAPVLSKSGMRTRTKVLIFLAAGVGVASGAWAIDHKVLDVTPSSLGTRQDGCKPFCGSPSQ